MALPNRIEQGERLPVRDVVAGNILALMGRYRVSQKALAAHLQISQPALSKRLSGKQAMDLDELERAAAFFGRSAPDLLQEGDMNFRCITAVPAHLGQMELPYDANRSLELVGASR